MIFLLLAITNAFNFSGKDFLLPYCNARALLPGGEQQRAEPAIAPAARPPAPAQEAAAMLSGRARRGGTTPVAEAGRTSGAGRSTYATTKEFFMAHDAVLARLILATISTRT